MGAVVKARHAEPTAQQEEEARARVFLAETRKALHTQAHIWDVVLELEVSPSVHNQRTYRIHATTKAGQRITGSAGYYVHPFTGTPENTAYMLAIDYRRAAEQRRAAPPAPAAPARASSQQETA